MIIPILLGLGTVYVISATRQARALAPIRAITIARQWLVGNGAFSEWRTASNGWAFTSTEMIEGGDRVPYSINSVTLGQNGLPVLSVSIGGRTVTITGTGSDTGTISAPGRAPEAMRRHRTGSNADLARLLPSNSNAARIESRKKANDGRVT